MKKAEIIAKYGEEAYKKKLEQARAWSETHPEQVKAKSKEECRKGGKHYPKKLKYNQTGLRGDRHKIRTKHGREYRPFKAIIAPDSQLHHEWLPESAEYRGVALVEADAHQYGIVDVIQILDGEITLLTEEKLKKQGKKR